MNIYTLASFEIIKKLRETNSTNEKIEILKSANKNPVLKKILFYTYNPYFKYGINKISFNEKDIIENYTNKKNDIENIFELLDLLRQNNINNELRKKTFYFLSQQNELTKDIYSCIILKDLKIGCNAKTINKVWKNLIPSFEVQLAENYFKYIAHVKNKEITITPKLDGHRVIVTKENDGKITFYSRQGKIFEGLYELENQFKHLPNGYVYDGEILTTFDIEPNEQYQAVSKILRKKGVKENLKIVLFDSIPLKSFQNQENNVEYHIRNDFIQNLWIITGFNLIEKIPILYQGKFEEEKVVSLLNEIIDKNYEGLMINIDDSHYEFKRTKNLLKVKKFQTADVLVKSIQEGTGKNKNKLGAIEIEFEYENKRYTCFCGSGFSDEQRELYFNKPELILNKVIEVQYFEITKNDNGGYGLRFPVFKHIRKDKNEFELNI